MGNITSTITPFGNHISKRDLGPITIAELNIIKITS